MMPGCKPAAARALEAHHSVLSPLPSENSASVSTATAHPPYFGSSQISTWFIATTGTATRFRFVSTAMSAGGPSVWMIA